MDFSLDIRLHVVTFIDCEFNIKNVLTENNFYNGIDKLLYKLEAMKNGSEFCL